MQFDKIEEAKAILHTIAKNYKSPIIYSGFGKDSICVIHLCRSLGYKWDIMFHRDPYFPKKNRYANYMIEKWDLVCRDYPAHKCSIFWKNGTFEVVRHYQAGLGDMVLCAMLYGPEKLVEGEYLCALKDIYLQPKGNAVYVWDIGIQGHKRCECKPHSGMQPNMMRWPIKHTLSGVDWAQPIQYWTEEDVYKYMIDNDIPINTNVYEEKDGKLVPKEDSTYNPDRRPACYRCMIPETGMVVMCPKIGFPVNNVSSELERVVMPNDSPRWDECNINKEV